MELNLTTERLLLRPVTLADIDLETAMFTDPDVVKYDGNVVMTVDELVAVMPKIVKRGGGGCIGIWCVTDRATGEKLGDGFLLPRPIDEDDTNWDLVVPGAMPPGDVEVGYFFKKSAWGKGYATEACRRLLRFAFEETALHEVVATVDEAHKVSRNVLEKCGLTYQGIRRAYAEDAPFYRITRDQWSANFTAS